MGNGCIGARLETDLKDIIGAKEWYEKSVRADHYPKALVHLGHLLGPQGPYIPLKYKSRNCGKLITMKQPQMKRLRTKVP